MKSKEEAGNAVMDVITMLEHQSGLKVKRLRSDNGSEFINSTMNKFCQWNSIIHETTLPYLPQQNGIAERAIAIIFKMVRYMLYSASLSLRYWGGSISVCHPYLELITHFWIGLYGPL